MRCQTPVGPCTRRERVAAVLGGAAAHEKVVKRRFEQFATGLPYQKHVASPKLRNILSGCSVRCHTPVGPCARKEGVVADVVAHEKVL
jgi:hypothetical protein